MTLYCTHKTEYMVTYCTYQLYIPTQRIVLPTPSLFFPLSHTLSSSYDPNSTTTNPNHQQASHLDPAHTINTNNTIHDVIRSHAMISGNSEMVPTGVVRTGSINMNGMVYSALQNNEVIHYYYSKLHLLRTVQ